jgi:hypothetical protein
MRWKYHQLRASNFIPGIISVSIFLLLTPLRADAERIPEKLPPGWTWNLQLMISGPKKSEVMVLKSSGECLFRSVSQTQSPEGFSNLMITTNDATTIYKRACETINHYTPRFLSNPDDGTVPELTTISLTVSRGPTPHDRVTAIAIEAVTDVSQSQMAALVAFFKKRISKELEQEVSTGPNH